MSEYFTKQVADILEVSIPTVRNYAKKLEQYNHEFKMRKQARIWTDTEISIIREATDLFKDSEYTLDTCFQYAIAKRNVGEDKAKELLQAPYRPPEGGTVPAQYTKDIQAILEGINDIKDGLRPDNELLEYKESNEQYIKELKEELQTAKDEADTLRKELEHVKGLNMWQFRKWKQDNL